MFNGLVGKGAVPGIRDAQWWRQLPYGPFAFFMVCLLCALYVIVDSMRHADLERQQADGQVLATVLADTLARASTQLQTLTLHAASDPEVVHALRSDPSGRMAVEQSLVRRTGALAAFVRTVGDVQQEIERDIPLSFTALDQLNRVANGQGAAIESVRVGQRWLLYSAAGIDGGDGVRGGLILVFDSARLREALPALPANVAGMQWLQQFPGHPQQVLFSWGEMSAESGSPVKVGGVWLLRVQTQLLEPLHWLPLTGALLLILLGLAVAGAWWQRSNRARLRQDIEHLEQTLMDPGRPLQLYWSELAPLLLTLKDQFEPDNSRALLAQYNQESIRADITESLDVAPHLQVTEQTRIMKNQQQHQAPDLPASIFRAYDIRGVIGETLTPETAYWIGRAIGSLSLAEGEPGVVVGRDGRLSGPELAEALIRGLIECGCQVIDVGMVPTPVLYFATNVLGARSGVMVTGSHNPPDYNGFKIVVAGHTLANEQITGLYERIRTGNLAEGVGECRQQDVLEQYLQRILDDVVLARPLKVVVDCGNGVAGVIAPRLIEALKCTVIPLYCEVDGTFPNHHPDPGKPENLEDLIERVKAEGADVGLAFDGDGDRVGVVTNAGTVIYPDRLMMLFAKDVVSRNPGADIIFDVKCSRRLPELIRGYGGRPLMWKTGHSLIKAKMKETGALLAGEMSGHVFFKERWYGFDDGIYSAARLLEILSLESGSSEAVFLEFPCDVSTPEINIQVTEESKFPLIERLQREGQWGNGDVSVLDGVRVDYSDGWGLVRASNTTPVLVIRFEADNADELARIQRLFREQLLIAAPDLRVPF